MKSICVYCGSHTGNNEHYAETASAVGREFAKRNIELIYGGGRVGLMGVIADAVLENGGKVQGVIPKALMQREVGHQQIQELHITTDMHSRKALMEKLSDGFLVLPGGFGTMDELFEIITWRQLGIHKKPVVVLNTDGYFDQLENFISSMIENGFVKEQNGGLVTFASAIDEAIERFVP